MLLEPMYLWFFWVFCKSSTLLANTKVAFSSKLGKMLTNCHVCMLRPQQPQNWGRMRRKRRREDGLDRPTASEAELCSSSAGLWWGRNITTGSWEDWKVRTWTGKQMVIGKFDIRSKDGTERSVYKLICHRFARGLVKWNAPSAIFWPLLKTTNWKALLASFGKN